MRSLRVSFVQAALVISLGVPAAAYAGGDATAGKEKSLACAACHISTSPAADTPHLVGQRETYIAKQLKAYKAGDRKNPLMAAVANQLSDADVANLSAYWSSQPAGSDTTVPAGVDAIKKTLTAFPKDFPKGYTVYLTSNEAEKKQISTNYINTAGFQAAKAGKPLPDGTAIVTVHAAAKFGADGKPELEKDGSWTVDKITNYAVMEIRPNGGKDIPEMLRNGNWNYGVFGADKAPNTQINQAICLACHKPQSAVSYLFSFKELQDKTKAK